MLVLTRREDESIQIDDTVEITVVEINGNTVKLGITAPRDMPVHRSEVYVTLNAGIREANADTALIT